MARQRYQQGIFVPRNPEKYKGSTPIYFRSSYESRFMKWADNNPRVLSWGSESIIVPYYDPIKKKVRRYFVDNNITLKDDQGNLKKYLIEIKPLVKTLMPVAKKHSKYLLKAQAEYVTNRAKWDAAQQWCEKQGDTTFCILTEKDLGIHK